MAKKLSKRAKKQIKSRNKLKKKSSKSSFGKKATFVVKTAASALYDQVLQPAGAFTLQIACRAVAKSLSFAFSPFVAATKLRAEVKVLTGKLGLIQNQLRQAKRRESNQTETLKVQRRETERAIYELMKRVSTLEAAAKKSSYTAPPQALTKTVKPASTTHTVATTAIAAPSKPASEGTATPSQPLNPAYSKYRQMLKVGIPSGAVLQKIRAEGLATPPFRQETGIAAAAPSIVAPVPVRPTATASKAAKPNRPRGSSNLTGPSSPVATRKVITADALRAVKLKPAGEPEPSTNAPASKAAAPLRRSVSMADLLNVRLKPVGATKAPSVDTHHTSAPAADKENPIKSPFLGSKQLRPVPRSPGGTPKKTLQRSASMTSTEFDLRNALRSRFALANGTTTHPTSPGSIAESPFL